VDILGAKSNFERREQIKNVYLILGDSHTRKSSTIRALTGAYNKRIYEIATQNGNIEAYVQISSLQESQISPEDFINSEDIENVENILVSLWIQGRGNNIPNGLGYIQSFIQSGWNIINPIIVLGTNNLPFVLPQNIQPSFIEDSPILPANAIANRIRDQWNWL